MDAQESDSFQGRDTAHSHETTAEATEGRDAVGESGRGLGMYSGSGDTSGVTKVGLKVEVSCTYWQLIGSVEPFTDPRQHAVGAGV